MANFMQAPVFLLEIQHLKQLKSVFLKIFNCAWKRLFSNPVTNDDFGEHSPFYFHESVSYVASI